MSSDNSNNVPNSNGNGTSNDMSRSQRRGSVTSAALTNLFRSNSISQSPVAPFPGALSTAAMNDQRRRLSITTLGLSGTSPSASASFLRRASLSTNSDSIDENAVEEDDVVARTAPTTPFTRRMSLGAAQAMRGMRGGTSPGNNGRPSPPNQRGGSAWGSPPTPPLHSAGAGSYTWGKISSQASTANQPRPGSDMCTPSARIDQGFNWSEQLRSRAESTVTSGPRASFSFGSGFSGSPPRASAGTGPPPAVSPHHDRARSVSDMPAPPAQAPRARAPQKPDHFQERILKGDFYMD